MSGVSFNRKAFWRRVCVFALVVGFSVTAAVLMFRGAAREAAMGRQLRGLTRHGSMMRIRINQMQAECRVAKFEGADRDLFRARIAELMEELLESAEPVAATWLKMGLAEEADAVRKDLEGLREATGRLGGDPDLEPIRISEVIEELESLEEKFLGVMGQAEQAIEVSMKLGVGLVTVARGFLVLTGVFAFLGLLMLLSDGFNAWLGPVDLEAELKQAQTDPRFQRRMLKLCPDAAAETSPWELTLRRTLHVHRTHTTFEAEAVRGEYRVLLWGKVHTWTGLVKGMQRLFAPAFGAATWKALSIMYNAGIGSPFPVIWRKIKRGPLTVGSVLLAEHVGELQSVKTFLRTDFVLIDDRSRQVFVQRLCEDWTRFQDLGFHSFTPRYPHMWGLPTDKNVPPRFYLFDLDKVGMSDNCHGWWHRLCARRDNARLLRFLRQHLRPSERRTCIAALRRDRGPSAQ